MDAKYNMTYKEMKKYLNSWNNNIGKSAAQEKEYPYKRIRMAQLGNGLVEGKVDSIRLLTEDNWDGSYVGSVSPVTAMQYGWKQENQVHPRSRDLVRFGLFFGLGFLRTLILIIKSKCEKYLYKTMVEEGTASDTPSIYLIEALSVNDSRLVDFAKNIHEYVDFDEIYGYFEEHNNFASNSFYSQKAFDTLIEDIVTNKVQAYALNSDYVAKFIKDCTNERAVIEQKDKIIQDRYYSLKQEWIELKNAIEQLLIQQANIRESHCMVRTEWSRIFGEAEIELRSLKCKKEELEFLINIKESEIDISYEDACKTVNEHIKERKRQYEKEKKKIELLLLNARMIDHRENIGKIFSESVSADKRSEYINKLNEMKKSTLAKVYFLTHPDKTVNENFTDKQREELLEMYNSINSLKENGIMGEEALILIDGILRKATKIWDNIGINIDKYDLTIINEKPQKMLSILETKIECLEEEDTKIRNEIFLLLSDQEQNSKEVVLNNQVAIEMKTNEYKIQIGELKESIAEYKETISELFKAG